MAKHVAKTIIELIEGDTFDQLLDRAQDAKPLAEELLNHFRADLDNRRPAPAVVRDGHLEKPTDLDLATVLAALVQRGAVIKVPSYTGRRPKQKKEGEMRMVSDKSHFGKITGLVSNKGAFSFNVRIADATMATTDTVGRPTNMMMVDVDGRWHDGWDRIEWQPTKEENDFIDKHKIAHAGAIVVEHFVHPMRWTCFYGQYYIAAKALITRFEDENKALNRLRKEAKASAGAKPDRDAEGDADYAAPKVDVGDEKDVEIETLEVELDLPELNGTYPHGKLDAAQLEGEARTVRALLEGLRFHTRATEYAFWLEMHRRLFGAKNDAPLPFIRNDFSKIPMPGWIKGEWQESKEARTVWQRFVLAQRKVGERGVALKFRVKTKTETVRM